MSRRNVSSGSDKTCGKQIAKTLNIGRASNATMISNAMKFDAFTASDEETIWSLARLESYQILSTAEDRRANALAGERAMLTKAPSTCTPDVMRKRRPDVNTRPQTTPKRPLRFKPNDITTPSP